MRIYIKYMVSLRCKKIAEEELTKLGLKSTLIELGIIEVAGKITSEQQAKLKAALLKYRMVLLSAEKSKLLQRIEDEILKLENHPSKLTELNYSDILSKLTGYDFKDITNMFSEVRGVSIFQYIKICKIEKVKEFLLYEDLTIAQIAKALHYPSGKRLSYEFKKITGLTPLFYKEMKHKRIAAMKHIKPSGPANIPPSTL